MFKIFKRRKDDVIDLVSLQKRGIIPQQIAEKPVTSISTSQDISEPESALGFLGNLAIASGSKETTDRSDLEFNYLTPEQRKEKLKTRILDMYDKLEKHSDALYDIKNILEVVEKRLERLERKTGVKEFETY